MEILNPFSCEEASRGHAGPFSRRPQARKHERKKERRRRRINRVRDDASRIRGGRARLIWLGAESVLRFIWNEALDVEERVVEYSSSAVCAPLGLKNASMNNARSSSDRRLCRACTYVCSYVEKRIRGVAERTTEFEKKCSTGRGRI